MMEEEQAGSETNAAEPSEEVSPIETIASASEEDTAQEERTAPTPTSPATNSAAKATEQRDQKEQAGETESSTTDEIIDLDASTDAIQAHTASSSNETKAMAFFPRVRTPCGHGAQVIVEGREKQSDGGENNKDHKPNKQNTTTKGPQAESPPSCSLSSVQGETCETRKSV